MTDTGLIAAYALDGKGGGERLDWSQVHDWRPDQGILWVHLNRDSTDSQAWLTEASGLDPLVVEALLAENTRPRCVQFGNGAMLFLRGVNLNPGSDPEDMVSIRLWIDAQRIISVRMRRLRSMDELYDAIGHGQGPCCVAEFVEDLVGRLVSRMASLITEIEDDVDRLQEAVLESESAQLRTELTRLRRGIIVLRRHLAPQRDALNRLGQLRFDWLSDLHMMRLREEADRVTRYVEDMDAARERAAVTQEELTNQLSEKMNARMYVLSVVAAIFLPLGFLTGLFGINVGGIPLAEDPAGFIDIVLLLGAITALQIVIFRWRRWF